MATDKLGTETTGEQLREAMERAEQRMREIRFGPAFGKLSKREQDKIISNLLDLEDALNVLTIEYLRGIVEKLDQNKEAVDVAVESMRAALQDYSETKETIDATASLLAVVARFAGLSLDKPDL